MITQFLTFYGPPTFVLPWLCWLPTPKTCCLKCNLLFCFMLMVTFYSLHARAHTPSPPCAGQMPTGGVHRMVPGPRGQICKPRLATYVGGWCPPPSHRKV